MDETTIVVIVTIILAGLPLVWAIAGWAGRRSWRAVLRGLGLALVPIGLLLTGLMRLLVRAVRLVVDWFAGTAMTTMIWTGVGLAVVGALVWFLAGFMTPVTSAVARERRAARAASPGQEVTTGSARSAQGTATTTSSTRKGRTGRTDRAGFTEEDRELERILKERGID